MTVPILSLLDEKGLVLEYDYGDDWLFSVRNRKPVYLKDEKYPFVVVQDANGYGIFEDNITILKMGI